MTVALFLGLSTSLIVTVTLYPPSSAYMWVPSTVNGPPGGPLIVPGVVGVPSPQSIVAEYSAGVEAGSGSVKVATEPANVMPSVAPNVVPFAVIGASAWNPVIFATKASQPP